MSAAVALQVSSRALLVLLPEESVLFSRLFANAIAKGFKLGSITLTSSLLGLSYELLLWAQLAADNIDAESLRGCADHLDANEQGIHTYSHLKDAAETAGNSLTALHKLYDSQRAIDFTLDYGDLGTGPRFALLKPLMLKEIESHERAMYEILFGDLRASGGNPKSTKKVRGWKRG